MGPSGHIRLSISTLPYFHLGVIYPVFIFILINSPLSTISDDLNITGPGQTLLTIDVGNGTVDHNDLAVWQTTYGQQTPVLPPPPRLVLEVISDAAIEELEIAVGPSLIDLVLAHEQFLTHTISPETDDLIQVEPTSAVAVILNHNTSRLLNPTESRLTAARGRGETQWSQAEELDFALLALDDFFTEF